MPKPGTQREKAIKLLRKQGIVRLSEYKEAGITAAMNSYHTLGFTVIDRF